VRSADLVQRKQYAFRLKQPEPAGEPFVKVTFIGPARGHKCRVRYEDGQLQGLDEWVPTRQVACPWGDRKALLRDEERTRALAAADARIWDWVTDVGHFGCHDRQRRIRRLQQALDQRSGKRAAVLVQRWTRWLTARPRPA
jgi:hypothetical protein